MNWLRKWWRDMHADYNICGGRRTPSSNLDPRYNDLTCSEAPKFYLELQYVRGHIAGRYVAAYYCEEHTMRLIQVATGMGDRKYLVKIEARSMA